MIITEYYTTREDGVVLNRTYSDQNMMIERNCIRYSEAIDPSELKRQYTETDEPIVFDDTENLTDIEKKAKAYDILMGVSE